MVKEQISKVVSIEKVENWSKNTHSIRKKDFIRLKRQLKRLGVYKPIIVFQEGDYYVALGGNMRLRALKELNYKQIWVSVVKPKSEAEKIEISLSDNNRAGYYDEKALAELVFPFKDIINLDDFKIELEVPEVNLGDALSNVFGVEQKKYVYRPKQGFSQEKAEVVKEGLILNAKDKRKFDKYKNLLVQFSGGRDSTCALWWCKKNFPEKNIIAVYATLEVEFPGMIAFVEDVAEYLNVKFEVTSANKSWWTWIKKEGFPSIIFRPCQDIFIHKPVDKFFKGFDVSNTLLLDGSRAKQAIRGSKKSKVSALPSLKEYDAYHPVYDLKEEAVWDIILSEGIPIWKGYNQGFVRTACWCCGGQCGQQAYMLQKYYPGLANEIRYWERRLGCKFRVGGRGQEKSFDEIMGAGERQMEKKNDFGS